MLKIVENFGRSGLRPEPRWGISQRCPRPPSWWGGRLLPPLQELLLVRRLRHDLILIVFGLTDMTPEDFFTFANSNHNTRGHAYKLLPSHCRVDVRKRFFAERVVKPWNCLPAELHHFSSLSVFKSFCFQY